MYSEKPLVILLTRIFDYLLWADSIINVKSNQEFFYHEAITFSIFDL